MIDVRRGKLAGLASLVDKLETGSGTEEAASGSLSEYESLLTGPLSTFKSLSSQLGGEVSTQASLVVATFEAQREFLRTVAACKKPNSADIEKLLQPTADLIGEIQQFRESNRRSTLFNHLSALSESIPALGWVSVAPTPAPFVKEMKDAGMFYTNRVLRDWKEKERKHVDWVRSWLDTLRDLEMFVRRHHTTGLVWNPRGGEATVSPHKRIPPKPAPVSAPAPTSVSNPKQSKTKPGKELGNSGAKQPSLRQDGKKWIVEYFKGDSNIKIDDVKMNQSVYIYKCEQSVIKISGKCNNVIMDTCRKSGVIFDNLVSSCEVMNSSSIQVQVNGSVPTIMVDKTDGCQIFLSKDSLKSEIVTAKSTEMNVCVPKGEDYTEMAIPEQFKTVIRGKKMITFPTESL